MVPLIGRVKNTVQSFWYAIMLVMNDVSAMGPRMQPSTIGAIGKRKRSNR